MNLPFRMDVLSHIISLLFLGVVCVSSSLPKDVYQVFHVTPRNESQLDSLSTLWRNASHYDLDFWQPPTHTGSDVHVMVGPKGLDELLGFFHDHELNATLGISDVEKLIEAKSKSPRRRPAQGRVLHDSVGSPRFNLARYHSYAEMLDFINQLVHHYPDWTQTKTIGTTHEGRPMQVFKVGRASRDSKPAIWLDGGIHAREWVAPSTALYFMHQLATRYESDPTIRHYVDSLDWYLMPVVNPDGYEYSRSSKSPTVRLWRKNRSPAQCKNDRYGTVKCCQGVDLNRNFDFHWGGAGSSSDPCEEIYEGTSAFSEPETIAVRDFILARRHRIKAFVTMHSYSQIWMYPYGHERRKYPADVGDLKAVALEATNALKSMYGTKYVVGTGADTLYPAAGGSDDWAKEKAGVKYVYLLELRPEDSKWDGFILSEDEILPTAKETFEGVKVIADAVIRRSGLGSQRERVLISNSLVSKPQSVVRDCEDTETQCRWWASFGGCSAWKNMDTTCPKSCGFCQDAEQIIPACKDERTDCDTWDTMRLCNWVEKTCQATCQKCRK